MSDCDEGVYNFFTAETIEDAKTYLEDYKNKMDTDKIVVKPSHYERYEIEPITFIMRNDLPFYKGNVIKYIARAGFKQYGDLSTIECEKVDIRKAIRYCEMRLNELDGKEITDAR